jgi:2-methylcitrate dehydratase PrpD
MSAVLPEGPSTRTAVIARFVAAAEVDETSRAEAARAVVDTLAVMLAGGAARPVRLIEDTMAPVSVGAPSFWSGNSYVGLDAATLYGMAAHMLDYDDVSMLTICHPTAPVLAAALAAEPWERISGVELLNALVIGTEVMIRLGETMGFRHYGLGFHATSTLGAVGAAAACARLKGLGVDKTAHALAIASSLASGLRKNFGSMVKPLHVGIAAANGVRACAWAEGGIEGSAETFEDGGFLGAYSGGHTDFWPDSVRLGEPFAIASPRFERKRYPCCYMLHKIIEATLGLASEASIKLDHLSRAEIEMPTGGSKPLIHPRPNDGLEARFSAPYAVVACLADHRFDLRSLRDAAVRRPEVQARLPLVSMRERDGPVLSGSEIDAAPVTVSLRLANGAVVSRTVEVTPGSARDPVTDPQLRDKWFDCFAEVGAIASKEAISDLFHQGLGLPIGTSLGSWLRALRRATGSREESRVKRVV